MQSFCIIRTIITACLHFGCSFIQYLFLRQFEKTVLKKPNKQRRRAAVIGGVEKDTIYFKRGKCRDLQLLNEEISTLKGIIYGNITLGGDPGVW
ncbi:hypothetical protein RIR_jg40369.t1 [Rhizophagus irregularis DAOM 181602=DAOM 197198]|nr:hypothetical protein RIR_jg40369.t1 [Rhizophagus irregularis DAOM 181602=DAOM 197198]